MAKYAQNELKFELDMYFDEFYQFLEDFEIFLKFANSRFKSNLSLLCPKWVLKWP